MVQFTGKLSLFLKLFVLMLLIVGGLAATAKPGLTEHFVCYDRIELSYSKSVNP